MQTLVLLQECVLHVDSCSEWEDIFRHVYVIYQYTLFVHVHFLWVNVLDVDRCTSCGQVYSK